MRGPSNFCHEPSGQDTSAYPALMISVTCSSVSDAAASPKRRRAAETLTRDIVRLVMAGCYVVQPGTGLRILT